VRPTRSTEIQTLAHALVLIALLFVLPVSPLAQDSIQRKGFGYVFTGVGAECRGCGADLHFGGGGERVTRYGLGIGGELGYIGDARRLSSGLMNLSFNGSYHIETSSSKMRPFVTGGVSALGSLSNGGGASGAFNVGGGTHYWFRERVGLRFEFREYLLEDGSDFYAFRVGFSFR
jgi:hypothetical protein